jgi:hypothetical protein
VHQPVRLVNDLLQERTRRSMLGPAQAPVSFKRRLDRIAEPSETPKEAGPDRPVQYRVVARPALADAGKPIERAAGG